MSVGMRSTLLFELVPPYVYASSRFLLCDFFVTSMPRTRYYPFLIPAEELKLASTYIFLAR